MTLAAAITDLRDTITEDGFTDDLVETIAGDWEINPVLLERKFTEKYGKSPAEYRAVPAAQMRETLVAKAIEVARANPEWGGYEKIITVNNTEIAVVELYSNAIAGVELGTTRVKVWNMNRAAFQKVYNEIYGA